MEDAKTAEINESEKLMSNDSLDGESKSENFALDILKSIGFALLVCGAIQVLISISMDPTIIRTVLPNLGSYFLLIMFAIAIIVRSGSTKELLRRVLALIIIASMFFGTAFLASKFNYDSDLLPWTIGLITFISFLKFVLGVPNFVVLVFSMFALVTTSIGILEFVPSPMNYILSMALMVVGGGTIWYLWRFADDGDSDDGFDGNDGIFDDGGIVGDGIFGADGIGGDGGGDGGGGGGDGGGGDGGGD